MGVKKSGRWLKVDVPWYSHWLDEHAMADRDNAVYLPLMSTFKRGLFDKIGPTNKCLMALTLAYMSNRTIVLTDIMKEDRVYTLNY